MDGHFAQHTQWMQPDSLWRFGERGRDHMIRTVSPAIRLPDPGWPEDLPSPIGTTYCGKTINPEYSPIQFRGLTDGQWNHVTCHRCFTVRFKELREQWLAGTQYLSNPHKIQSHPAYQQIIALGLRALPLIFKELEGGPQFWWEALRQLTHENPVTAAMAGDQEQIRQAWLAWWARGYLGAGR